MAHFDLDDHTLGIRSGLPDDLLRLRAKYPRESWPGHANLGEWVQFWLSRHGIFRDVGAMLDTGCAQMLDGQLVIGEFRPWFMPRLQFLLGHLDLHHRIEEFHIFPAFARAEPGLAQGFALLEADHDVIHRLVDALTDAAAGLAKAGDDTASINTAVAPTQRTLIALTSALTAHLDDEEDLIVPIVLERSEADLGLF